MIIKDLEISKELSRKELSAVRGGVAVSSAGGQAILQAGPSLFSGINAVNAPNATANDNDTTTLVSIKSASVFGSLGTFLFQ
jgi:hypothetical protein